MVTFYCPKCWSPLKEDERVCPHCSVEIQTVLDQRDYIGKLIAALSYHTPNRVPHSGLPGFWAGFGHGQQSERFLMSCKAVPIPM
jgi:hypothetical protein